MLDFLALMMALVALIVARKAFNQVAVLRARLEAMQAPPLQPRPGPPLPLHDEPEPAPVIEAPGVATEQPTVIGDAEPAAPLAADPDVVPNDAVGSAKNAVKAISTDAPKTSIQR